MPAMHFGFSYIGLLFLALLMIPNLIWTRHQPRDYDKYAGNENRLLLALERIGEVLSSCAAVIFSDFNIRDAGLWTVWLALSAAMMALYEVYWIRYFRSEKTMNDFYSSLLGIPVAGATLPVAAFFLLGIYGKNLLMLAAVIILGIGHIGIHLGHKREIAAEQTERSVHETDSHL